MQDSLHGGNEGVSTPQRPQTSEELLPGKLLVIDEDLSILSSVNTVGRR